jgi:hypothetical protein
MISGEADHAPEKIYFATIEEEFVRLRGAPLVLSPADWHLAATWHRQGIPLSVVLAAIHQVMETAASRGRRRPVLSLSYCRHEVEAEFDRFLEAAAGDGQRDPIAQGPTPAQRLERKAQRLERCCREYPEMGEAAAAAVAELRRAAAELEAGGIRPEEMEQRLMAQERALLDRLESGLPAAERDSLQHTCEERLEPYRSRMAEEAYRSTLRHACDAALRRRFKMPRLSLLTD